jgi:hypothetical protein
MLQTVGLVVLALVYGGSGLVELPQWRRFTEQFVRWGFPAWWAAFNPALKIAAGALVLWPPTRTIGVALCMLVALGALATVLRCREKALYKAAIPVAGLTFLSAAVLLI